MKYALLLLAGCSGGAASIAVLQGEVATYEAQQIQCVTLAATKGQADECRNMVKRTWCGDGGALREAGACQ